MNARNKSQSGYQLLRARLIERGITLRGFAIANGYSIPTVYDAAKGRRAGVVAVRIRNHLNSFVYGAQ